MNTRILLLGVLLAPACGDSAGPIDNLPRQLTVAETQLVETDNRFAFKLFQEVNQAQRGTNVFIGDE